MSFPPYVYSGTTLTGSSEFLTLLRDLSREFGFEGYSPSTVRLLEPRRSLPSDQPLVFPDGLILPTTLIGKLELSEWKPLIASALVFRQMAREKRLRRSASGVAMSFALALLLFPVFIFFTFLPIVLFKAPVSTGVLVGLPAYFGAAFVLGRLRFAGRWRKMRLKADQQAAAPIGKDVFFQVLEKIDNMHLDDVEKVKRRGFIKRFFYTPSILDRMKAIGQPTPTRDEDFSRFRKQWTSGTPR
jgi:hypothetical protein